MNVISRIETMVCMGHINWQKIGASSNTERQIYQSDAKNIFVLISYN